GRQARWKVGEAEEAVLRLDEGQVQARVDDASPVRTLHRGPCRERRAVAGVGLAVGGELLPPGGRDDRLAHNASGSRTVRPAGAPSRCSTSRAATAAGAPAPRRAPGEFVMSGSILGPRA